jgi:hypothetical protein
MLAIDNYSYKKYQKELAKKKKKEEKKQNKLDKKNMQAKAHLALSDGKCAVSAEAPRPIGMPSAPLSAEAPRPIGMPSAPLSAADSGRACNEDVTVV